MNKRKMKMPEKRRVKCANCGMIYDIIRGSPFKQQCPGCGSNAYDDLPVNPMDWVG